MRHLTPLIITRGIIMLLIIAGTIMRVMRARTATPHRAPQTSHQLMTGDKLIFTPSASTGTISTSSGSTAPTMPTGTICLSDDTANQNTQTQQHKKTTTPRCRTVEIANTPHTQHQGLMHRESLVHHEGMLFMFDETKVRHFWMRDVLLPLDMIWIDSDRRVQGITHALPCPDNAPDTACPRYRSPVPVPYVLEIAG